MGNAWTEFLRNWAACYALLAGIYLALGYAISRFNRRLGESKRIQQRVPSPELIRRDFRQSLKSLLTISAFLAGGISLREAGLGWAPVHATLLDQGAMLVVSMLIFDTWFYWGHRAIHTKPLYRKIHAWHHRAVTPTVWSNNSDTFLDNCFAQSYWLVAPLFLPLSSTVLVLHKVFDQVTGMIGHAGYEYSGGPISAYPSPLIGVTFHDQHHQKFRCNYATHFSWWDRLMGTLDPTYDETVKSYAQAAAVTESQTGP